MPVPRTPDPGPSWLKHLIEGGILGPVVAPSGTGDIVRDAKVTGKAARTLLPGVAKIAEKDAADAVGATGIGNAIDAVQATRRWVSDRHNWARVGYVTGGAILFVVGAAMVAKPAVTSATSAAKGLVP